MAPGLSREEEVYNIIHKYAKVDTTTTTAPTSTTNTATALNSTPTDRSKGGPSNANRGASSDPLAHFLSPGSSGTCSLYSTLFFVIILTSTHLSLFSVDPSLGQTGNKGRFSTSISTSNLPTPHSGPDTMRRNSSSNSLSSSGGGAGERGGGGGGSSFMRASKFRHVYATPSKLENTMSNLRVSSVSGDQNFIAANSTYCAVGIDVRTYHIHAYSSLYMYLYYIYSLYMSLRYVYRVLVVLLPSSASKLMVDIHLLYPSSPAILHRF